MPTKHLPVRLFIQREYQEEVQASPLGMKNICHFSFVEKYKLAQILGRSVSLVAY